MRSARFLCLGFCLLFLHACSTGSVEDPPPSPKADADREAALAIKPGYKIGIPYTIKGRRYRPQESFSYARTGIASWYGEFFHGRLTANGEVYDMYAMTAAHKTLQLPTIVRVTNLENGKAVVVRVNDDYESTGYLADYGPSERPVSHLHFAGVAGMRNLIYLGGIDTKPELSLDFYNRSFEADGTFQARHVKSRAMGDDFTEIVAER